MLLYTPLYSKHIHFDENCDFKKGNPKRCTYEALEDTNYSNDFGDTFLDGSHVIGFFPGYSVSFCDKKGNPLPSNQDFPPYRLVFDEDENTIQCVSTPYSKANSLLKEWNQRKLYSFQKP